MSATSRLTYKRSSFHTSLLGPTLCCILGVSEVGAICPNVPGDINSDGVVTVTDVQCAILAALFSLGGGAAPPTCLQGQSNADITCDGLSNVADVVAVALLVLGAPSPGSDPKDCPSCPQWNEGKPEQWPACSPTRLVGRVEHLAACPAPQTQNTKGVVKARPLFLPNGSLDLYMTLPKSLQKYCLYEWQGDPALAEELPADGPNADWLDQDCHVNAPMAGSSAAMMAGVALELHQDYMSQLGTKYQTVPGQPAPPAPATLATVAFIDTAAQGLGGPSDAADSARHACALGELVANLACNPASTGLPCGAKSEYHVALDLGAESADKRGGYFGYQGTLAEKVVEAVTFWKMAGKTHPLVINLSVGWDSRYNADDEWDTPLGDVRISVDAAREAIEYAACQGALVIAAAGNAGAGPEPGKGPLYPAAWEELPVPTECQSDYTGDAKYAPLVFAVGGVDATDTPLLRSREGGIPRLVAPAFHAVYNPKYGACDLVSPLNALTGTSVAAAVTSATAAWVWSHKPSMHPAEVMELIYTNGASLDPDPSGFPMRSDFPVKSGPWPIRRLDFCAVAKAIVCGPEACGISCNSIEPYAGNPGGWTYEPPDGAMTVDLALPALPPLAPPLCGGTKCPSDAFENNVVAPYRVNPQPGVDPCTECYLEMLSTGWRVTLPINPLSNTWLRGPKLSLLDAKRNRVASYSLDALLEPCPIGAPCLRPGHAYRLLGPTPPEFRYARVEFVAEGQDGADVSEASDIYIRPLAP